MESKVLNFPTVMKMAHLLYGYGIITEEDVNLLLFDKLSPEEILDTFTLLYPNVKFENVPVEMIIEMLPKAIISLPIKTVMEAYLGITHG